VALGETLQELVVLLRMQELLARVVYLDHWLGQRIADMLALPRVPRFMVEAAYRAPRRDR
jgi:hypothetical protein